MSIRAPQRRLRRLTEEEVGALVRGRLAGEPIETLAERFGIGRSTVMKHCRGHGVPVQRWQGRTLAEEQIRAAGRLYETGVSLVAVGAQFGVDRRYLRRALPEAGFTIRLPGLRA